MPGCYTCYVLSWDVLGFENVSYQDLKHLMAIMLKNTFLSGTMTQVDPTMGDKEETKSRLDDIKYYTSLFLGALAINCVFGFLFLVPFVLDPAISTLMHEFVEDPVHCKVTQQTTRHTPSAEHQLTCIPR